MLATIQEANEIIRRGTCLTIAGSQESLSQLRRGNWIGGSIPYFMTRAAGALCDRTRVYIDEIQLPVSAWKIQAYTSAGLRRLPRTDSESSLVHGTSK